MIVVNLNIRGMGGGCIKSRYVNNIIAYEGEEFVCLQETKLKVLTEAKCFSVWGNNRVGWLHNEGVNGCGSLLSMWNLDSFSYASHVMGKGFIAVFRDHLKSNLRCVVVNVYAACNMNDKRLLWGELSNVKVASQDHVWCFCGDFNVVRRRSERKGIRVGDEHASEIVGFNSFIDANLLVELPIVGKRYTWF